ncbi:Short-chain dehydrogenase reductase SAT2 [Hyphodiscus hymeniophilus]|uniref:Short-chain dehydrogenase reductase SAT2 n=1 Tax=Hyphodiscus hymeniophilus TaxID=353542 RepID=A0A9P6VRB9_9HELO|nr:Short-chain dehydrogenase reductase SAT2 [Hyphodiscus hymeniophilus]
MVPLTSVTAANRSLTHTQPLVAVFVGATSGIGKYTLRALAKSHGIDGSGLRVYVVGRNERVAKSIIAECNAVCSGGEFVFVEAQDLALLGDVDRVCGEVKRLEEEREGAEIERGRGDGGVGTARVDLLVMTHAIFAFEDRNETKEGLDAAMSLLYYSRMRFIVDLMSLLENSVLETGAHVVSVFGPGREAKVFPDDLSLRNPQNYGFMNMGSHVAYFTTLFMENLSRQHRLSLTHYYPSLVLTEAFGNEKLPRWFRWLFAALKPLMSRFFFVPNEECGMRVLFLGTERYPARGLERKRREEKKGEVAVGSDGVEGGGHYRIDWDGEVMESEKIFAKVKKEGLGERVVRHTESVFETIGSGAVFKE